MTSTLLSSKQGPKCKGSKIGIVGAGPAGLHMAYLLKKNGFTNVEVLEQANRHGGKSHQNIVDGAGYTNTYLISVDHTLVEELMRVSQKKLSLF